MKKRINLFLQKKKTKYTPSVVFKLRKFGLIMFLMFFIASLTVFFAEGQINARIKTVRAENRNLENFIKSNAQEESKIAVLLGQNTTIKTYLKDDVNFLPYYNLLQTILANLPMSPRLETLSLDNKQVASFVVIVDTYEDMQQFINALETNAMLQHFVELNLSSFTIGTNQTEYILKLQGKFKPVYEK